MADASIAIIPPTMAETAAITITLTMMDTISQTVRVFIEALDTLSGFDLFLSFPLIKRVRQTAKNTAEAKIGLITQRENIITSIISKKLLFVFYIHIIASAVTYFNKNM